MEERPSNILIHDDVVRDHGTVVRRRLFPGLGADIVRAWQLLGLFVGAQRLLRVLSEYAVNLAPARSAPYPAGPAANACQGRLIVGEGRLRGLSGVDGSRVHLGAGRGASGACQHKADEDVLRGVRFHSGSSGLQGILTARKNEFSPAPGLPSCFSAFPRLFCRQRSWPPSSPRPPALSYLIHYARITGARSCFAHVGLSLSFSPRPCRSSYVDDRD